VFNRFLLLIILSVNSVFATDTTTNSLRWLTQMQESIKILNYQGTVVFLKNNTLDSMKYFHAADKGVEQEHLLSLNSPVREILRNADKVSCLFKDLKKIEINHLPTNHSFIINLPKDFNKQTAYYDFELGEQAQVAMLPTQVILVKPKDEFRYARKIWIDKHHFLPLKSEVYDPSGVIIEQVMFTELKIKKSLPFANVNLNSTHLKVKHIHQTGLQAIEKAVFVINNIPQGFKEVFFIQMQMHGSKQSVKHLLLSDGFSSVSIYQEAQDETVPLEIQSAGSVNSLVKRIGKFQFVIMGDVPVKTIQFIANGISLKTKILHFPANTLKNTKK
jgi:sigma-E factor negative regulatory protein RseB